MVTALSLEEALDLIKKKPNELMMWQYYQRPHIAYKNEIPNMMFGYILKDGKLLLGLFENKRTTGTIPNIKFLYSNAKIFSHHKNHLWMVGTKDDIKPQNNYE